jgi:hypothetical protein
LHSRTVVDAMTQPPSLATSLEWWQPLASMTRRHNDGPKNDPSVPRMQ